MGWRDRLLNSKPETVGRAMKFGGGRILSQQDMVRPGMKTGGHLDNMTINKKGQPLATRVKMKKGGDGKWIQKVDASIKRRGTKGKCTPITKPGCTGRAKALAKTFKKMAAKRKKS